MSHHSPEGRRKATVLGQALLVGAVLVGALTLGTPTANAAAYPSRMNSNGSARDCTNTGLPGCVSRTTLYAGQSLYMHCWIDDSYATGPYRSNRWFYVTASNGVRAFVHSSRVDNQTSVGNCTANAGISASRWAAMQVGETKPSSSEAAAVGITNGVWSGWCQAFARGAYVIPGFSALRVGSAAQNYREYDRRRLVQKTNLSDSGIRIGSLVYYSTSLAGGLGHVAVYVGNGMVVSTQGTGDPSKPIARLSLTTWGAPIGVVIPANVDGVA